MRESGEVECWESFWDGLYGGGGGQAGRFRAVSADSYQTCGLRLSGEAVCWGYGRAGDVPPPGPYRAISAGWHHACAVHVNGAVVCWMVQDGVVDVPIWLRRPTAERIVDLHRGRILARRLPSGRTMFAWQPAHSRDATRREVFAMPRTPDWEPAPNEDLAYPRRNYFPALTNADPWLDAHWLFGGWLRFGPIEVEGVEIGWIEARLLSDGRIEFGVRLSGGERILPERRYFPARPLSWGWLRSEELDLGG